MSKILIVDRDGIVRDSLKVFLSREGHLVTTAVDGAGGVLAFRGSPPDLVILDKDLPGVAGHTVFQALRELSGTVPVILLAGDDSTEDEASCRADGAACALSKAAGLSSVLEAVGRILGTLAHPGSMEPVRRKPAAAPVIGGPRGLILVADDDEAILKVLRQALTGAGHTVITAADGIAAERLAREKRPDITLLDVYMPGKDGLDVLKDLVPEMQGKGIMMITGNEDEDVARNCLRLGAFDYLPKPINLDALAEMIRNRLALQSGRL